MFLELKLLKIRGREEKKLNRENHEIFKVMEEYIVKSTLSFFEKEEVFQQILDIMLQSQMENKDINLFLGKDHKEFCDSIIDEYNESKSFVLKSVGFIEEFIIYIIMWLSLDMLFSFKLQFKLGSLITASLFCIITFIKKSKITNSSEDNIKSAIESFSYVLPIAILSKLIVIAVAPTINIDINMIISLYSARYFAIISILFLLFSELYKIKSNKVKIL
ncbi:DUF1048 domain-containing protein [Clostridium sp. MSJ-11]|uniref:DUF1048 domain-containing protein n=1 Tax=Clostridium mobile TaxID=2841512 RepID=A0ABS6EMQ3_9CLOT|nr:DUF1048 domain-containing protein [Clostridium mobile]MBU5485921.1 DUF1048 domain-containing protein [Clostridium mobile]